MNTFLLFDRNKRAYVPIIYLDNAIISHNGGKWKSHVMKKYISGQKAFVCVLTVVRKGWYDYGNIGCAIA
jgi:hypothetical protein